jgi:glycosyltransferase involved in cell wall biosynthesis
MAGDQESHIMKRILYLISTLRYCGPVVVLYNIVRHLDRRTFQPLMMTLSSEPNNSMYEAFALLDVPVTALSLPRSRYLLSKGRIIRKIKEFAPDIIHTHGPLPDSIGAMLCSYFTVMTTVHGNPLEDYPFRFGHLKGRLVGWWHILSLRRIQNRVSISHSDKVSLQKLAGLDTRIIYNGIESSSVFPISTNKKFALRARLDLPEQAKICLMAGTFSPRKDQLTAIHAFKRLSLDDVILVLIGHWGSSLGKCMREAGNDHRIIIRPDVSSPSDYMQSADVYLSTSRSEGFGLGVVEALSSGLYVCLTDIPPHREILSLNPEAGIFFPIGDDVVLAQRLEVLLCTNYGCNQAGLEIAGKLSAENMSLKYQRMYKELIDVSSVECN